MESPQEAEESEETSEVKTFSLADSFSDCNQNSEPSNLAWEIECNSL